MGDSLEQELEQVIKTFVRIKILNLIEKIFTKKQGKLYFP